MSWNAESGTRRERKRKREREGGVGAESETEGRKLGKGRGELRVPDLALWGLVGRWKQGKFAWNPSWVSCFS